jgi:hypothetical protein
VKSFFSEPLDKFGRGNRTDGDFQQTRKIRGNVLPSHKPAGYHGKEKAKD